MKKLVSLLLACMMLLASFSFAVAEEKPVTISLLTTRQTAGTNDVTDLWIFKYLEDKFNVKFELEQTMDETATSQRIGQMYGSGDLPDIVLGINLTNDQAMSFIEEDYLLSWNDLITAEKMPNTWQAMQDYPDAFAASTAPDGKIYSLPYIRGAVYYNNTGAYGRSVRVYVNTEWMEKSGVEKMPENLNEVLDMLRAFKNVDPKGLGEMNMPLVNNSTKFYDYVWHCMGFYGANNTQEYGTRFAIRDGEVVLPAYTEQAKAFLTLFNTMYNEGLFSKSQFESDKTMRRGWISAGYAGVIGDDTLQYTQEDWPNWVGLPLVPSEYCENPIASVNMGYTLHGTWVNSAAQNIDKICEILDYFYSDEGAALYMYGPMKGQEVYEGYEGWYFGENGERTCDPVIRGEVNGQSTYVDKMISPCYYIGGRFDRASDYLYVMADIDHEPETAPITDALTGHVQQASIDRHPTTDNWDGWWNIHQAEVMEGKLTFVILPNVYMTAEQSARVADLKPLIEEHIKAESANFIAGVRPLDEFDAYMDELKALGIEEYIQLHKDAYTAYMEANFAK